MKAEVAKSDVSGLDIRIVDAAEEVGMAEKVGRPTHKKRSSILIAVELVEKGEADAFFSAGNTAACWTSAKMTLGTLPEIDRPALTSVVPNIKGKTGRLDVGAGDEGRGWHAHLQHPVAHHQPEAHRQEPHAPVCLPEQRNA